MEVRVDNLFDIDSLQKDVQSLYRNAVENYDASKNDYDMSNVHIESLWNGVDIDAQPFEILSNFEILDEIEAVDILEAWELVDDFFEDICAQLDELVAIEYVEPFVHWFYTGLDDDGVYSLFLGISKEETEEIE